LEERVNYTLTLVLMDIGSEYGPEALELRVVQERGMIYEKRGEAIDQGGLFYHVLKRFDSHCLLVEMANISEQPRLAGILSLERRVDRQLTLSRLPARNSLDTFDYRLDV
jgi:hypothetical protein